MAVISRFMARQRRCRAAGIAVGALAGRLTALPLAMVAGAMIGFLVASVFAAATGPLRPNVGTRVATLIPRVVGDYVSARYLIAVRGVAGVAVAVAVVGLVLPSREQRIVSATALSWSMVAALIVVAVVLTELAARRVVTRPQVVSSESEVCLDDAIRSACARSVVGAGLGLVFLALSDVLWMTDASITIDVPMLGGVLGVLTFCSFVAAPLAWVVVAGSRPWRVRRTAGPAGSAAAVTQVTS
ncbi:MAG: hypothetical protein ACYDAQ_21170 [Mycobacteriales bacterium]